ncbi:M13 family metallopeptidase [Nocardia otitidiscaviarum]|uniref:M13 family metallopeptidase n=1 Tax=Nocardia otitidiscaviarum TaxID=1823 RepID=UPI0024548341|nr:M13 family metallopeptidase [Nocardia otitidiscaviarum]
MTGRDRVSGEHPHRPCRLDRRRFLGTAAAVPLLVALASCSSAAPRRSTGPDLTGMDPAVRPQDDLYRHVNGAWLREVELPPDKPAYGAFEELIDGTEDRLRELLEELSGSRRGTDEQRLHHLYRGFLDTAARDRAGIEPLADLLSEIEKATDKTDLARVAGKLTTLGVPGPIGVRIQPDRKDPSRHRAYLVQSGLGMPDRSFYLDAEYDAQRGAYRTYLERIATAAGMAGPAEIAARTLALETEIARGHVELVELIASLSSYQPYAWRQLPELAPGFDWDAWLAGVTDAPAAFDTIVADQPRHLTAMARLWAATDPATLRDYLRLLVVTRYAPTLSTPFTEAHFEFFDRALQGTRQPRERWRTALRVIRERLGDALGRRYAERYFPAESRALVEELVTDLLSAYRTALSETTWMSEATRREALAKVDRVVPLVGYPENWRDYSGLDFPDGPLIAALRAADTFEFRWQLAKLGRPVDRAEWSMLTPADVNASYSWELNHICLPAAILQPPFFDPDADAAVNYGGIGMVIAHEMGHGFDSGGSKFDAGGSLRDWWTAADKAAFEAKTRLVVEQYDPLVPAGLAPEHHVDGALTVIENLADLRGMATALAAFRLAERRRGNATPDYRPVFLAYARMWRSAASPEYTATMLALDSHSPAEFRVNQVVRNMPEFYTAFEVRSSDRLYLAESTRVAM